jgi:3-methyladenine DNA glycosylase AlkD
MKSEMPFLGMSSPVLRRLWKEAAAAHPPDADSRADVLKLWHEAGFREERYAALMLLCQVGFKGDTDLGLLYDCIEPNLGDREFFVRKAVGWALRDYAWHDPHEIARYVAENQDRLSPLSRREATKNLARLLT